MIENKELEDMIIKFTRDVIGLVDVSPFKDDGLGITGNDGKKYVHYDVSICSRVVNFRKYKHSRVSFTFFHGLELEKETKGRNL